MAFSGGVFSRLYSWQVDRDAAVPITASRMDSELDGMATALSSCVLKDGTQTITANIPMSGFLFTGAGAATARTHYARADQVQDDSLKYAAVSGTDTYTATLTPAITAYANGLTFIGKFTNANTGAATLNLNSVGAIDIKKAGGAALVSGDIGANTVHTLVYNSTGPKFELVSPVSNAAQPLDADLTTIAGLSVTRGALLYGTSSPAWGALAVGGASTVLRSDGTDVSWGTVATAAIADNAVTGAKIAMGSDAQGDILYYNGTDYARLGAGTSGQFLKTQGAAANPAWANTNVFVAEVSLSGGTGTTFSSIPAGVRRITVNLRGVSLDDTDSILIQLGTSGGLVATGYASTSTTLAAGAATTGYTTGFGIRSIIAANVFSGHMILTHVGGNVWVAHSVGKADSATTVVGGGDVSLGAELDRLAILDTGADNFDAGTISIMYEF